MPTIIKVGNLLIASLLVLGLVFSCSDRVPHSSGGTIGIGKGGFLKDTFKP